jgi:hypothetical protein
MLFLINNYSTTMTCKQRLIAAFLLFMTVSLTAQSKTDPTWYTMMHTPKVNYYKAVAAYEAYWKGKKTPRSHEQNEAEEEMERDDPAFKSMKPAEKQEYQRILMLNKEFVEWMRQEASWVQPDGSILSLEERQALLDKQRQELKAIEIKNGKN